KAVDNPPPVRVENGQVLIMPGSAPENSVSVEAAQSPAPAALTLNGRIVWDDNVTTRIFTPLAGRVTRIAAEVGQVVQRGDVLALIASPDFGQAQADFHKAASDFLLKQRTLERVTELHAHGAAPLKDLQAAQADFEQAQSEKLRCEMRLALYGG